MTSLVTPKQTKQLKILLRDPPLNIHCFPSTFSLTKPALCHSKQTPTLKLKELSINRALKVVSEVNQILLRQVVVLRDKSPEWGIRT